MIFRMALYINSEKPASCAGNEKGNGEETAIEVEFNMLRKLTNFYMRTLKFGFCLTFIVFGQFYLFGQDSKFQAEKPGKFILQNQLDKCPGANIASFSKNLTAIAEWIHQNDSVLNPPVGFDASFGLSGNSCEKITGSQYFGIESRISLSCHFFYIEKGVTKTATDWAAHDIELNINQPDVNLGIRFDETGFLSGDPEELEQPLKKALENLETYYSVPPAEKEVAPGVRLYASGHVLIFNPDRPDIWIPVTVREIMQVKLAYYKVEQEIDSIRYVNALAEWAKLNIKTDPNMRPQIYDIIQKEYKSFSAEELNLPAFTSAQSGISSINAHGEGNPVARFNAASWDRTLPATAVQFISLEYKPRAKEELEEFKLDNSGLTDYIGLFINSLPLEKMGILIQKK